jgi:hypothetical protein
MEPNWVRPAYLRLMCLVGIVEMAYGLLGFVLGIVHVASPSLQRQSDPIFRIASAVVDVAQAAYAEEPDQNPTVIKALDKSKSELDRQARAAGLNELLRGFVLSGIGAAIQRGEPFSQAVAGFPEHFSPLYVATIKASERTGNVREALGRYIAYQEELDKVKKKIVSATIYPAILAIVGALVLGFLMFYVVPRFARVY